MTSQEDAARRAISHAWDEGSPVARKVNETASLAVRRWNSSERRLRRTAGWKERVEDLARGLVQQFESDPKLVGPLINDYRYVAECVGRALAEISFTVSPLDSGRVLHHKVLRDDEPITWRDLLDLLNHESHARLSLSAAITSAAFAEVFFECPPITSALLDEDAEFVLVDASLSSNPDPSAFAKHLATTGELLVTTFQNLRGDATLVVPAPIADDARRNYLRSFLRTAPEVQVHSFWKQAAAAIQERINDVPVWVSTSGGGVPWLHLRLDDRPKYYSYRPYTSF